MSYDEALLCKKRDEWFDRLQAVFDGKDSEKGVIRIRGAYGRTAVSFYDEPEKYIDACIADIIEQRAQNILNDETFVPICIRSGVYGVHFIDKIFGANVYSKDNQWYNDYLTTPIGSLQEPDLESNETFDLVVRMAKRFSQVGGKFALFGLPTIASALNIAINLYGQEMLISMIEEPELARRDLETINRVLVKAHRILKGIIPRQQLQPVVATLRTQPPGYGQICGCSTHLVGAELYRELVADLDEEVLNVYENGGMIHLCGDHVQHLETFKNMKSLKAIQLNDRASEDLQLYFEGTREDQIIYLECCEGMPEERALEITKGRRLVLMG